MHWPSFVKITFNKYLNIPGNCNDELAKSLRSSPRTKKFLDNLSQEISKAERLVHKRRGRPLKLETIRKTVEDMTALLIRGIENEAKRRIQSVAELTRQKKEADYLKDLDATADGKPQGEFEDMEIIYGDTEEVTETRAADKVRS